MKKNGRLKKRICAGLLAVSLLFLLCGCEKKPEKLSRSWFEYFDTVCTLIACDDAEAFADACGIVEENLAFYDALFDIYDDAGFVNAKSLNDSAGQGAVSCDPELAGILSAGTEMYDLTDGECNIAFGAVLKLWHEARESALGGGPVYVPETASLQTAAEHCDIRDLLVDPSSCTVTLSDPEMSLDLGAVAKGYTADRIIEALSDAGHTGCILSLGGNVKANGEKLPGEPWITGIADPDDESGSAYLARVRITDQSLVTSGSYQRYYELDGVRYHHIISPETLQPKNDYLSVTILTESSTLADALSTAVFNMDFEKGSKLIEALDGVEAAWVFPDRSIRYSSGFESFVIDK